MEDNRICHLAEGKRCIRPDLSYCGEGDSCAEYYDPDEIKTNPNPTKPVDPLERAKELAEDHWKWAGGLLARLDGSAIELVIAKYLYETAFIHGYKHALEDIKSKENN